MTNQSPHKSAKQNCDTGIPPVTYVPPFGHVLKQTSCIVGSMKTFLGLVVSYAQWKYIIRSIQVDLVVVLKWPPWQIVLP